MKKATILVPITRVGASKVRRYPKGHPKAGKFVPKDEILTDAISSVPAPRESVIAFKGFTKHDDGTISCRSHKFEIGKEYNVRGVVRECGNGFHACKNPFDVFNHYPLSRYHTFGSVELLGPIVHGPDKLVARGIRVLEEFSWPHFLNTLIKYARDHKDSKQVIDQVRLNGQQTENGTRKQFDLNDATYSVMQTSQYAISQLSSAMNQLQVAHHPYSTQMAFGKNSRQIGAGWQVSWADKVNVMHIGHNTVEVYGKDCIVTLTHPEARVKGAAGTVIRYIPDDEPHSTPLVAVIGEKGLEPNKPIFISALRSTTVVERKFVQ